MSDAIPIFFKAVDLEARYPQVAYTGDAGWDLFVLNDIEIPPWSEDKWFTDVRSGIAMALPEGYYARLVGRSSAIRRRGLQVHEGIIDAGFRGELFTCVSNLRDETVYLYRGDSICQIIIQEVKPIAFIAVSDLPESERGEKGFGSSGN